MKDPKTYDSSYYFDMTFEEGTPEYVIESLFERALDELLTDFRNRKAKDTDILIEGDLSYNDVNDDYEKEQK
jgi:ABC-type uncharacterized transport system substrate-binding protein